MHRTEKWKPVKGYEEYAEISNYGQIHYYAGKSIKYPDERWTYGSDNKTTGYLRASFGGVNKGVHVWVYLTFVGDIPKGYEVNHIDENKHNNRLDNLNLMTPSQNINWGTRNARVAEALRGRKRPDISAAKRGKHYPKVAAAKSKAVQALNPKTLEVVYEFSSTSEAGRQGFNQGHVAACCRGERKTHKGLLWQFKK